MAVAEIEARGFEHEALQADDGAGVGFEDLWYISIGVMVKIDDDWASKDNFFKEEQRKVARACTYRIVRAQMVLPRDLEIMRRAQDIS